MLIATVSHWFGIGFLLAYVVIIGVFVAATIQAGGEKNADS